MKWVYRLVNLFLYGNFWIALCAAAAGAQTFWLLIGRLRPDPVLGLLFGGTLCLYAIHRLIGIHRMPTFQQVDRYALIYRYRSHILLYGMVGGILGAACYWMLAPMTRWIFLLPAVLGAGYILPIWNGKRLRDFHYIKIFLIALCWALLTVTLPAFEMGLSLSVPAFLMTVERALFIFAITLPFDIRDLELDSSEAVRTIPGRWGARRSRWLGLGCLGAAMLLVGFECALHFYSGYDGIALAISFVLSGLAIWHAHPDRHDYFFSGWIDGMILLQAALIGLSSLI